ncbi:MAG: hypothetical protein KUG77_25875 [Nannocystaceae bacterium]|nr:hypothetical protein [Nannocystaceae bacterium]
MTRLLAVAFLLSACSTNTPEDSTTNPADSGAPETNEGSSASPDVGEGSQTETSRANVSAVSATGGPGAYTFAVTLASPDTGCDQYANWWEVLDADGALLYRRILAHSHVDEQPFTRTGGPVPVDAEQVVFVRAHMSNGGFGDAVRTGTAAGGFSEARALPQIAASIEAAEPQPSDCAF